MNSEKTLTLIKNRRSIRKFKEGQVPDEIIDRILDAGRWAPSGKNNQPWRFSIIRNPDIKTQLSELTKYTKIVQQSNTCIAVFFHIPTGYHRDKDMMSLGACIQNMLLTAESEGIGALWIGEILARKEEVNILLDTDNEHELAAVIALGYPDESPAKNRNEISTLMLKNYL